MICTQLYMPSQIPTQSRAHPNMQYLTHLLQLSMALPESPILQSMHRGAHRVQQQESQYRQAIPNASQECQTSMQQAALQAHSEKQKHWQHFLRNSISTNIFIKYDISPCKTNQAQHETSVFIVQAQPDLHIFFRAESYILD